MIGLILKTVIAIIAAPVAYAITVAFYHSLILVKELAGRVQYFAWGVVSYAVMHLIFYRPVRAYVFGHEAMHAVVSWLFGGQVKKVSVSKEGGSTVTTKSNTAVELAPYFVPVYALLIMVAYFVVAQSYRIDGSVFIFLIGFALAFHVISTVEVMKTEQADFVKSGHLFSVVIVYILNLLVIAVIFTAIFPSFSFKKFITETCLASRDAYVAVWGQLSGFGWGKK